VKYKIKKNGKLMRIGIGIGIEIENVKSIEINGKLQTSL
jgi:hypothetical protein